MSYASEVLADAPLVYYRLGETSGTVAVDSSGNGRDGTYVGTPTLGVVGLADDADTGITTSDGNDSVTSSSSGVGGLTNAMFEVLLQNPTAWVVSRDNTGSGGSGWFLALGLYGPNITIRIGGVDYTSTYPTANLQDGNKHQVVWGATLTTVLLYVDGALVWSTPRTSTSQTTAAPFTLGKNGPIAEYVQATFDEWSIYTSLSATRVAAHWAALQVASTSNATPTGVIEVTSGSSETTERLVGDMDVTVAVSGGSVDVNVDLWFSTSAFGTYKYVVGRIRRDNISGPVIAKMGFNYAASDDAGGHSTDIEGRGLHWLQTVIDQVPTTGRYVVTLQANPNACRIYSDTHKLSLVSPSVSGPQDSYYSQVVKGDHPVAYWRCNERQGTAVQDYSGHGRGANIHGLVAKGQPSIGGPGSGSSFRFRGVAGEFVRWIDSSDNLGIPNAAVGTIEFLLKPNSLSSRPQGVFQLGQSNDGDWMMRLSDISARPGVIQGILRGSSMSDPGSSHDFVAGNAYHVAITRTPRTGGTTATVYVNGLVAGTYNADSGTIGDAWAAFPWDYSDGRQIDGWISDVAVYDYALTTTQIDSHLQALANVLPTAQATASAPVGVVSAGANLDLSVAGATASAPVGIAGPVIYANLTTALATADALLVTPDNSEDAYLGLEGRVRTAFGQAFVGTPPANDPSSAPVLLTGTSGTADVDLTFATLELDEPVLTGGIAFAGSVWYRLDPGGEKAVTLSVGPDFGIDVFLLSDSIDTFVPVGGADSSGVASVHSRAGEVFMVRVYPRPPASGNIDNQTLSYNVTTPATNLTVQTSSVEVPGTLRATISSDVPNTNFDITFDSDPVSVLSVTTDASGDITFLVDVPNTLALGAHLLVATSADRFGSASFVVTSGVYGAGDDASPDDVPPLPPTARWRFQDPTESDPDLASWEFPINPKTHDSLTPQRNITQQPTTAIAGQPFIYEGLPKPKLVTLTGELLLLTDVQRLRTFRLPWRIYLTDDLGRTFEVKVVRVNAVPDQVASHPERHTFTVQLLLYRKVPPS